MLAKLRLDQTKTYEQCVAALEVSKMLVAFVQGREHNQCIGVEQGGIETWDDLVITKNEETYHHIQIKRQTTPFSSFSCDRYSDRITKNKNKGELRDLSPFDKALNGLADYITDQGNDLSDKRIFTLIIPSGEIEIKKSFTVNHLHNICNVHIKEATTAVGLEELSKSDSSVDKCFLWLTTWCGFQDWDHILKAFRLLTVQFLQLESEINNACIDQLNTVFSNTDSVLSKIKGYTLENSTYTGAIAPRRLLGKLKEHLLPQIATWTQFENDGANWKVSGTHDLEDDNEIERSSQVVPKLWGSEGNRQIKIVSNSDHTLSKPHAEVFQMALHLKGQCHAYCYNWSVWKEIIRAKLGGTLGTAPKDFEAISISDNNAPYTTVNSYILSSLSEKEEYAIELSEELTKQTWNLTKKEVSRILTIMNACELRDALEKRWYSWIESIDESFTLQKDLFIGMLHPNAEGKDIEAQLRVGSKTIDLIGHAIYLYLIVSVALDDDHKAPLDKISDLTSKTLALRYWSGPSGEKRIVQKIDDQNSIGSLIGKSPSEILVITESEQPEGELLNETIADEGVSRDTLASDHRPKLLVTHSRSLQRLIRAGKVKPITDFLQKTIKDIENLKESSIQTIAQ